MITKVSEDSAEYTTPGGIKIFREAVTVDYATSAALLAKELDTRRGLLLASSFEYPGRYTRWDIGFVDPPIALVTSGRSVTIEALNERGTLLLPGLAPTLSELPEALNVRLSEHALHLEVAPPREHFLEEQRSKQSSVFTVLRALVADMRCDSEPYLGLYGAFGYELTFQFDPIQLRLPRDEAQRDLVLYLPDEILVVDHRRVTATKHQYEFEVGERNTRGLSRRTKAQPYIPAKNIESSGDHAPGEYAATVETAREHFARGDLFEVVPGQMFFEACPGQPSALFERLKRRNPAPYGALINLGDAEYLVAASPEMYVRVAGQRIETCPISGTIARGADAIADADQVLELLSSEKETSELTMCTDVDRNDKSRVCVPGSVKVIGRRQIEMYSRLIHTVDHVEGTLAGGYDALDGFLAHTWAVTVTGAPKHAAIQFIEDHERSPRCWYGGAIGAVGFDGSMNTGLTLRTVRVKDGRAEIRAGATLLFDSDPDLEEAETRLKASALLDAIRTVDNGEDVASTDQSRAIPKHAPLRGEAATTHGPGAGLKVLMVDHQDSFVHTLASYLRETGAHVSTLRSGFGEETLREHRPDLIVLSPGPGTPTDFGIATTIGHVLALNIPLFGVCLGLQGIVEYFGGTLSTLDYPMHGKPSIVHTKPGRGGDGGGGGGSGGTERMAGHPTGYLFEALPPTFKVGRYHSLVAEPSTLPACLSVTATTQDGTIMAIEHNALPISAVQFHPESILSLNHQAGHRLLENVARAAAATVT
jgi:anthranilate synthase